VLEGITLAEMVKLVVKMLVNFTSGAVLDKKASENSKTAHPHDLTVSSSISILANSMGLESFEK
jgi:hypothetical protein